jgi:RimJ/RimL family protein N-acetyltransferase
MNVKLSSVTKDDWDLIYDIRINKEYRKNFYIQQDFSKEYHYSYLENKEKLDTFFHWMILDDNTSVGYIRILDNDISIMIHPQYIGKGIGSQALALVEKEAKKLGLHKLIGRIMIENKSSKKIFEKNNYNLKMFWFEKDI